MKVFAHWPLILAYHSIHPDRQDMLAIHPNEFAAQLELLARQGYRSMTLADYCRQPARYGERVVIITFDDGYEDNYRYAWPVLRQFGYVGTVFLVSNHVGTDRLFAWNDSLVTDPAQHTWYRVLDWDQIDEMQRGGIEFGSHTVSHPHLTDLAPDACRHEIEQSRAALSTRLGEVTTFCYPHGDLNASVAQMVQRAGYSGAVVTPLRPGLPLNRFTLRRIGLYHVTTLRQFRIKQSVWFRRYGERFRHVLNRLR